MNPEAFHQAMSALAAAFQSVAMAGRQFRATSNGARGSLSALRQASRPLVSTPTSREPGLKRKLPAAVSGIFQNTGIASAPNTGTFAFGRAKAYRPPRPTSPRHRMGRTLAAHSASRRSSSAALALHEAIRAGSSAAHHDAREKISESVLAPGPPHEQGGKAFDRLMDLLLHELHSIEAELLAALLAPLHALVAMSREAAPTSAPADEGAAPGPWTEDVQALVAREKARGDRWMNDW